MNRRLAALAPFFSLTAALATGCGIAPRSEATAPESLAVPAAAAGSTRTAAPSRAFPAGRPATRARMLEHARRQGVGRLGHGDHHPQTDTGSAQLVSILIQGGLDQLPIGLSEQLIAIGVYDDGSVTDVSSQVTWYSDATEVLMVSNEDGSAGMASALAEGVARVSAALPDGTYGGFDVLVNPAVVTSLAVDPASSQVAVGLIEELHAIATMSDGQVMDVTAAAQWQAADPGIAGVDDGGRVLGVMMSSTFINCTIGSQSYSAEVVVTPPVLIDLALSADHSALAVGEDLQLVGMGSYSDGTSGDVSYALLCSSNNVGVADVDAGGLVHAFGEGDAIITCNTGSSAASFLVSVHP